MALVPNVSLDGAASVRQPFSCTIFHACSWNNKKKEWVWRVGEVAVENNGVGCQSEGKGRKDRCCCQDLSVKTNGCCKDEASKTLENSDVVNRRPVCLHLSVCHVVPMWVFWRVCGWMKCMYRCGPWLLPFHMGECWEIDFGGLWGWQR